MPLNLYTRAAPYAPRNHQKTNLSTEPSSWGEAEALHLPQHLDTLNSSLLLCQPFLPSEQAESEEYGAAFPLPSFAAAHENSGPQPSIQTNNGFHPSYFSEASEAVSHLFPNQFTWNPPAIVDPNLTQHNISYANFPLAEEGNDTSPDLAFNARDPALQPLFNSVNGVDPQALYADPGYLSEVASSVWPPMCSTAQLVTSPAIINQPLSPLETKGCDAQPIQHQPNILPPSPTETLTPPLKQTNELTPEEASQALRARSSSSDDAMLSSTHTDKKKIKIENEGNSIKTSRKPRKNDEKRAAQNRLSQNTFRAKKRMYLENLEKEHVKLKEEYKSLEEKNIKLKEAFKDLERENIKFRSVFKKLWDEVNSLKLLSKSKILKILKDLV